MSYLKDKKILLTGATGGFGQEFTRQLLQQGSQLILTDMDSDALEKKAAEIKDQCQGSSRSILGVFAYDLSTAEGCENVYKRCKEISPHVDILINNAGILTYGYFHEHPAGAIKKIIDVNVLAPMLLARLFLADMTARRSGHIVFLSSLASVIPTAFETSYTATKCAIRGFGMALHREVLPLGIAVTNIYPTYADTNMLNTKAFGSITIKRVSSFMIYSPKLVVRHAIRGIAKRRLHVFPGLQASLYSQAAKLWPMVYAIPLEKK